MRAVVVPSKKQQFFKATRYVETAHEL